MVRFTHEQIGRSPHIMEMVCRAPYSVPEKDGIVIFENAVISVVVWTIGK